MGRDKKEQNEQLISELTEISGTYDFAKLAIVIEKMVLVELCNDGEDGKCETFLRNSCSDALYEMNCFMTQKRIYDDKVECGNIDHGEWNEENKYCKVNIRAISEEICRDDANCIKNIEEKCTNVVNFTKCLTTYQNIGD